MTISGIKMIGTMVYLGTVPEYISQINITFELRFFCVDNHSPAFTWSRLVVQTTSVHLPLTTNRNDQYIHLVSGAVIQTHNCLLMRLSRYSWASQNIFHSIVPSIEAKKRPQFYDRGQNWNRIQVWRRRLRLNGFFHGQSLSSMNNKNGMTGRLVGGGGTSVTSKTSPNVYKSCPKWFH